MEGISRRSFIELACGSIISLPVLSGGLVLAPRPAYADANPTEEAQLAGLESEYVVIDVVYPYQVGFMVVDVTKGTKNDAGLVSYPPVKGATVTVTSRFNKKKATGTTDKSGVANIDIRELSVVEKGEDVNHLSDYYFNGTVSVVKDGWRNFKTELMVVEGGTGLQVPAHPMDSAGTPYPLSVSFDEWDALYSKNEFLVTSANAGEHTINVSLLDLPGNGEATVELWVDGEKAARKSAKAALGQRVEIGSKLEIARVVMGMPILGTTPIYATPYVATFKARFLKKGDADALPVGAKLKLRLTQGGKVYSWPLAIQFSEGVIDKPAEKKGQKLSPINTSSTSTTALDVKWPSNIPMMGGGNLKFWTPELPIDIYVNPFGYVQITLKTPSWGYLDDQGRSDQNGWGTYPRKSVQEQWNKKVKAMKAMSDKTAALVSKPGAVQQLDLFKKVSAQVNAQAVVCAKWDSDKGLFQGQVALQALLAVNFTITENFFAGPFPVLITFALDTSFIASLSAAAYSAKKGNNESLLDAVCDFSRWNWDYQNTGLSFTLNITPSLSVGIGIRGVASISVKGAITLTLFLGIPLGSQPKGLPSPHFSAGWSAQVLLVIELFFFTKSFSLYNKKFENFYDNWDGKDKGVLQAQAEDAALQAMSALTIEEMLGQLLPITDTMLEQTSEASVTTQSLSTQSVSDAQEDPFDWEAAASVVEGQMADGTSMTYTVYDLSCSPSEERRTVVAASGDDDGNATLMAGSSPDLVAQAVTAEPEPADVQWLTAQADESLPAAGVAELGLYGGIRPSSDMRLFGTDAKHVFGAPRAKVVSIKYSPNPLNGKAETSLWCFRIASVQVSGNMRTRVVANCVEGPLKGRSHIIEFDTKITDMSHDDLYDYDFDIACNGNYTQDEDCVELVIISGKRDASGMALANASSDLVFTGVRLVGGAFAHNGSVLNASRPASINNPIGQTPYTTPYVMSFSRKGNEAINYKTEQHHSILSVQMMPIGTSYNLVTFLDRCAETPGAVLGETADVSVGVLFIQFSPLNSSETALVVPDQTTLRSIVEGISDKTVYEQDVSLCSHVGNKSLMTYTIMLRGSKMAHYVLLGLNTYENLPWQGTEKYISRPSLADYDVIQQYGGVIKFALRCKDYDPAIRLVPCPAKNCYLTSYPTDPAQLNLNSDQRDFSKWTLHEVSWSGADEPWNWNNASEAPKLVVKAAGPSGFNVTNFAVNAKGTFIFWPQSRDVDEDRVWKADGDEHVKERPATYQLMGCRLRNNKFSDPFIVADLAHDTDALTVIDTGRGAMVEALRTEYVDTGEKDAEKKPVYHAADIWYTSVPPVRCVTATACEAADPFVVPGDELDFHVAVRNDGNVYLAGCTLDLCLLNDATKKYERVPGASAKVTFSKDTIQESSYNLPDGNGGLKGLEDDYALAPGKSAVHSVRVAIPKDWKSGAKKVLFVASEGVPTADSGVKMQGAALSAQADDDSPEAIEFHIEPGAYDATPVRTAVDDDEDYMDTLYVDEPGDYGDFDYGEMLIWDEIFGDEPDPSGSAGGAATRPTAGSPAGSAKGSTPSTGDPLALGLLGAAVVAAGAAVTAYERRRAENEAIDVEPNEDSPDA